MRGKTEIDGERERKKREEERVSNLHNRQERKKALTR